MTMVSDALFSFRGKEVEILIVDQDDITAFFVDNDSNGIVIKGKDENDDEYIEYMPFRNILGIRMLTSTKPKKIDAGLEIEDSDEMLERKQNAEIENDVAVLLGKECEVDYSEGSITVTDDEGNEVITGDQDGITVLDEKAFELSKKIAVIIGAKKITRDYQG